VSCLSRESEYEPNQEDNTYRGLETARGFDDAFSANGAFSTVPETSARILSDEVKEMSIDDISGRFPALDIMFSSALIVSRGFPALDVVFSNMVFSFMELTSSTVGAVGVGRETGVGRSIGVSAASMALGVGGSSSGLLSMTPIGKSGSSRYNESWSGVGERAGVGKAGANLTFFVISVEIVRFGRFFSRLALSSAWMALAGSETWLRYQPE
jgi:hypothetical protein